MLCSKNVSIGIFDKTSENLLHVERDKLTGIVGEHTDKFFSMRGARQCTFRSIHNFQNEFVDNEFNRNRSVVHLMEKKLIDICFWSQDYGIISNLMSPTHPINTYSYQVSQIIEKTTHVEKTDLLFFFLNNKLLFFMILLGFFIALLTSIIFLKTTYRKKTKGLRPAQFTFFDLKNVRKFFPKIAAVIVFFTAFMFFMSSMFVNSIQTNVIVFDTDDFIDSVAKIYTTKRQPIFHKDDSHFEKIYSKKFKKKIFIYPDKLDKQKLLGALKDGLTSYFFFTTQMVAMLGLFYISNESPRSETQLVFNKQTSYYETSRTLYMRKSLEKEKEIFMRDKTLAPAFENGIFMHMFKTIEETFMSMMKSNNKIYTSIEEFSKDFIKSKSISFDNFKSLFILFFAIQFSILFLFLASMFYKSSVQFLRKSLFSPIYKFSCKIFQISLSPICYFVNFIITRRVFNK